MSTRERKNETAEKNVKKFRTYLDTCQYVEYGPIESKNLSLKSSSIDCKEINYEGEDENQVSKGGEADLHKHRKSCKKNPGHPEFIPIESLHEVHNFIDLEEYIKAAAEELEKCCVSWDRPLGLPDSWPYKKRPYVCPFADQNYDLSINKGDLLIGEHENQVSEGGEADLHKHKNDCKKNPGHTEFIPIESFSLKHLPEGHQDIDLYDLIKAQADLTVKLTVALTSPDRPQFWPNTNIPYFLSDLRGKKRLRTASGMVCAVQKYTYDDKEDDEENPPCPCDKCKASDKPSIVWWEIFVQTAAHVIVDEIEAKHTTLRLFYDREDSEEVILKINACYVHNVDIAKDVCEFTCVTCDENLGNTLERMSDNLMNVREKVREKYTKSRDIHKLNFIVSHPHGCSKMISVGRWKDREQARHGFIEHDHRFSYTTCTCPGSSGANVHCVGYNDFPFEIVHSGSLKSGLNHSALVRDNSILL